MVLLGNRRVVQINGIEYGIYQLPCSDQIEQIHPEGMNYLIYKSPGLSERYKILGHFKTFPEAELFLISQVKSNEGKDVVRIDITKHKLYDGELYQRGNKISQFA